MNGISALVPAAGLSRRMGRPKLILPFRGSTVLETVVRGLLDGGCGLALVVAPPADRPESAEVVRLAERAGAIALIPPIQPPDMKASLLFGLQELERQGIPKLVMIAPGDAIGVTAATVELCLQAALEAPDRLIVPVCEGKRGHPLGVPWRFAAEIRALPDDLGVNAILQRHESVIRFVPVADPMILEDLDEPTDYERWR